MFIVLAVLVLFGWFGGGTLRTELPKTFSSIFPNGMSGWWSSLIYAFYAFGGIEIMGLMAVRLKKKDDVQKAGSMMLITLAIVYITTILLALVLTEWNSFHEKESPFVTALSTFDLAFFPHLFNGALIIAGFSTMTASMFAVTNILITLSESGDAPKFFLKNSGSKRKIPFPALSLTAAGLFFSIVLALFMPGNVYEYITTAAGLMLLLNWCFILMSSRRLLTNNAWDHFSVFLGLFLIASAIGGTILNKTSRIGLYFCLCFLTAIFLVLMRMQKVWKKKSDPPL
jgi:L-asparagine transporter-like permease